MEWRKSSLPVCSAPEPLWSSALESTCVVLSAVLRPISQIISNIPEFLWLFRAAKTWQFPETLQKVHLTLICNHHGPYRFFHKFVSHNWRSSSDLRVWPSTAIFKLTIPLVHTLTIYNFITINSFNLNKKSQLEFFLSLRGNGWRCRFCI